MKKLNLGCGNDIRKGWVNLDSARLKGVDVVHDITKLPLPFKSDTFDYILCKDILEHVKYIPVLKELHRILKKGGVIDIEVPHFTSKNNFIDPTHIKIFSFRTFDFFLKKNPYNREYYFDFSFSERKTCRITFEKKILIYNYILESLVNMSDSMRGFYESSFLRIFPAENIKVTLKK